MSDNSTETPLTPPLSPKSDNGVRPTKVWFVSGKKNNKAFRSALALYREDATLHEENKENVPPEDDHPVDPQQNQSKET